jgi:hypothetical protein
MQAPPAVLKRIAPLLQVPKLCAHAFLHFGLSIASRHHIPPTQLSWNYKTLAAAHPLPMYFGENLELSPLNLFYFCPESSSHRTLDCYMIQGFFWITTILTKALLGGMPSFQLKL